MQNGQFLPEISPNKKSIQQVEEDQRMGNKFDIQKSSIDRSSIERRSIEGKIGQDLDSSSAQLIANKPPTSNESILYKNPNLSMYKSKKVEAKTRKVDTEKVETEKVLTGSQNDEFFDDSPNILNNAVDNAVDGLDNAVKSLKFQERPKVNEEEFFQNISAPEPKDPTIGIIYSQGHWVFHLACLVVMSQLNKIEKASMTCDVPVEIQIPGEETSEKITYDMSFLNNQLSFLTYAHLISVVLLFTANSLENRKISNHYSQIFNLVSLCLYIGVIFSNIQAIFDLKYALMSGECEDFNDRNLKQWIMIEILAFLINIFMVVIKVFAGKFCVKKITLNAFEHSLRQSKRIWSIVEDKEALNEIEEDLRDEQSSLLGISATTWAKVGFSILKLQWTETKIELITNLDDYKGAYTLLNKDSKNHRELTFFKSKIDEKETWKEYLIKNQDSPEKNVIQEYINGFAPEKETGQEVTGQEVYNKEKFEILKQTKAFQKMQKEETKSIKDKWFDDFREYVKDDKKILNLLIPESMVKKDIGKLYNNKDLLRFLQDQKHLSKILLTQISVALVLLWANQYTIYGELHTTYLKRLAGEVTEVQSLKWIMESKCNAHDYKMITSPICWMAFAIIVKHAIKIWLNQRFQDRTEEQEKDHKDQKKKLKKLQTSKLNKENQESSGKVIPLDTSQTQDQLYISKKKSIREKVSFSKIPYKVIGFIVLDSVIFFSFLGVINDESIYQKGCETFLLYFIQYDYVVSLFAAVNIYFDFDNQNRMELLQAQYLFTSYMREIERKFKNAKQAKIKFLQGMQIEKQQKLNFTINKKKARTSCNKNKKDGGSQKDTDFQEDAYFNKDTGEIKDEFYKYMIPSQKDFLDIGVGQEQMTRPLDLQEDIYCLSYLTLITSEDVMLQRDLNFKAFLTCFMQIGLGLLVVNEVMAESSSEDIWKKWLATLKSDFLYQGDMSLNLTRLICAIILHISIMPEVRSAVDMMRFLVKSPEKFKNKNLVLAFSFCFIKYTSAVLTEFLNILKMAQADNIDDVVKDFIAFGIIVEIDNMILRTISRVEGLTVEDYFAEHEQSQEITDIISKAKDTLKQNMSKTFSYTEESQVSRTDLLWQKIMLLEFYFCKVMYVFLRFVYILFYYYFFQIVIIYIVYFWGEHRWDGEESEVKSFLIYGQ